MYAGLISAAEIQQQNSYLEAKLEYLLWFLCQALTQMFITVGCFIAVAATHASE
jgi:hypothetical protein